jgi:hypothetical protein
VAVAVAIARIVATVHGVIAAIVEIAGIVVSGKASAPELMAPIKIETSR